ncbi:Uncharacterised protein [Actinobacillus equuli]|nr:Uncharacterised protein [Actinobacillus equuli]
MKTQASKLLASLCLLSSFSTVALAQQPEFLNIDEIEK